MKPYTAYLIVVLFLVAWPFTVVLAGENTTFMDGWRIYGRNSLHFNYYDSEGDPNNSAYAHKFGKTYNDLSVNVTKDVSPYNRIRGNISGVYNDSEYRYNRDGFTIERFNLSQEQGETLLPYRLAIGDHYGFFTPRTIQKSLKGGQLEFQPTQRWFGADHGIQVIGGDGSARDYRDSLTRDSYYGGSWLMQWKKTALMFNWTANKTQSDPDTQTPQLHQAVGGVALNHSFELSGNRLELDSEFTQFQGDPQTTGANADNNDKVANAFFLKVSGRHETFPVNYNLKYEDYSQGYQPKGASVSQDRQTIDANVGYLFNNGLNLRLRRQYYQDNKDTSNATDTHVFGATLSGAMPTQLFPDLNMNLDTFVNRSKDENLSFQSENRSVSATLSTTLIKALTASLTAGYQDTENELTGEKTNITRSLGINLGHPFVFEGMNGSLNAGITFQGVEAPNNGDNDQPGFNLGLTMGQKGHRLDLSAYYREFQPAVSGQVMTQGGSMAYTFTTGPHSLRLEGSFNKRDPDRDQYTTDYMAGLTYDYTFDLSGKISAPQTGTAPLAASDSESEDIPYTGKVITGLPPGTAMVQAQGWLNQAGVGKGVKTGNVHVYETRFFDSIYQRQRLALLTGAGDRIEITAVIVDLGNTGTPETIEQLYKELQALLTRQYGIPRTYEQGEFGPAFFAEVNSGQFIRNSEWFTPSGIVRLGFPRRLDRQVRMEVQLRKDFPGEKDTLWSVEQVR